MRRAAAMSVATLALVLPAQATAQTGPRQTFSATFTINVPGAPSGLMLGIDYVNPDDPDAKPPAVAEVVIQAPEGARVDTSVPPRCDAPDPLLMALGAGACPDGSVVGRGELALHTGAVISEDAVTLLNAADQLIFLTRPEDVPIPGGVVTRSAVEDGAFHTAVPPIPGLPPPDTFTALDRVQLELEERITAAGSYITTPPACPAGGVWVTRATFTYRDGVTQSVDAESPCAAAATTPEQTARGCLARKQRVDTRGIGALRIGDRRDSRMRRLCVRGGGRVLLSFSRRGGLRLVATTARGHRARGIGRGMRMARVRRTFPDAGRLGPGLLRASRSSNLLIGHRGGRVRFLAVAGRREAGRPALLRHHLRRAGLR